MNYIVSLTYRDDKKLNIEITEEQLEPFMEAIKMQEMFWSEGRKNGFYTDLKDIRYLQLAEKGQGEPEKENLTCEVE